jgi:hypothetical protein
MPQTAAYPQITPSARQKIIVKKTVPETISAFTFTPNSDAVHTRKLAASPALVRTESSYAERMSQYRLFSLPSIKLFRLHPTKSSFLPAAQLYLALTLPSVSK